MPTKITKQAAISAAKRNGGILTDTAAELGVSRRTLNNYCNRWPELKQVVDDARQELCDAAERTLSFIVQHGEERNRLTAAIYITKTIGKARGYVERQQLEHSGSANIDVRFTGWDDPDDG